MSPHSSATCQQGHEHQWPETGPQWSQWRLQLWPVDEQLIQGQIKSEDPLINLDSWKEGPHTSGPAKRMSTAWVQAPRKMPGMLQGPLYQCHLFWLHEVWEGRTTH